MIKAKMTNKKLAEKVADGLGWKHNRDATVRCQAGDIICNDWALEDHIFSWPTFGLMVERAAEMGWKISWVADNISFSTTDGNFRTTSQYLTGEKSSDSPIKACALAFLEIFDNETR